VAPEKLTVKVDEDAIDDFDDQRAERTSMAQRCYSRPVDAGMARKKKAPPSMRGAFN